MNNTIIMINYYLESFRKSIIIFLLWTIKQSLTIEMLLIFIWKNKFLPKIFLTNLILSLSLYLFAPGKDGTKMTTVVATPGQGSDRAQEVSYTDTRVIGNGSFGVVFQAKLVETNELVAIKKVLQDRRFKVSWAFGFGFTVPQTRATCDFLWCPFWPDNNKNAYGFF